MTLEESPKVAPLHVQTPQWVPHSIRTSLKRMTCCVGPWEVMWSKNRGVAGLTASGTVFGSGRAEDGSESEVSFCCGIRICPCRDTVEMVKLTEKIASRAEGCLSVKSLGARASYTPVQMRRR